MNLRAMFSSLCSLESTSFPNVNSKGVLGRYPKHVSNGELWVEECKAPLYACCTYYIWSSHNLGCLLQCPQRKLTTVMLATSVSLLVYGWKTILLFSLVSIILYKLLQNLPRNRVSRSMIMDVGNPKWTHTCRKKR
jgi:hypothetical protein